MAARMSLYQLLLANIGVIACAMLLLWLISIPAKNASIVDTFWGPTFAVVVILLRQISRRNPV